MQSPNMIAPTVVLFPPNRSLLQLFLRKCPLRENSAIWVSNTSPAPNTHIKYFFPLRRVHGVVFRLKGRVLPLRACFDGVPHAIILTFPSSLTPSSFKLQNIAARS